MKSFAISCKASELAVLLEDMETKEKWLVSADRCPICWSRDVVTDEIEDRHCLSCGHVECDPANFSV